MKCSLIKSRVEWTKNEKKSPNEFGLKAAFKKPKVLGQSPKGSKVLKPHSSQAQKNPAQKDIFPPAN